jgi:hypothetical protein
VVGSEKSLYPDTATDDTARLWFLPADGRLPLDARLEPHSIGIADAITGERIDQLKANLTAIFRATGLSRLSSVSTPGADESEVDFSIRSAKGGATVPLLSTDSPVVAAGDEILVAIENKSVYPVDIDILLIGPNYAIQHLMGHRFQAGDHLETPLVGISATSFGQRRLVQISRQVKGNAHHSDLSLLEQPGIRSRAGGQGAQDVAGLIDDLIDAPATRAAVAYQRDAPKVAIRFFDVESVP